MSRLPSYVSAPVSREREFVRQVQILTLLHAEELFGRPDPSAGPLDGKQWDGRPHPDNGIDVPEWRCH